jgi:transcriptional regulator with XRE-family HTH domain
MYQYVPHGTDSVKTVRLAPCPVRPLPPKVRVVAEQAIPLVDDLRRRIAAARAYAHGMSQDKLGKAIGVGRMTIVRTERGDREDSRKEIPVAELRAIAEATGLELAFFLVDPQQLAAVGPSLEERVALLEVETAQLAAIVRAAVSPEQLEAEQRQFLDDWLRRTTSRDAEDGHENSTRGGG